MRILLIAGRTHDQNLVAELSDAGYIVKVVSDGHEGLRLARSGCYDLIILRIDLPNLDGRELVRILRAEENETLVMFLAAGSDANERVSALNAGGDAVVEHYAATEEFLARVRAVLRRR